MCKLAACQFRRKSEDGANGLHSSDEYEKKSSLQSKIFLRSYYCPFTGSTGMWMDNLA